MFVGLCQCGHEDRVPKLVLSRYMLVFPLDLSEFGMQICPSFFYRWQGSSGVFVRCANDGRSRNAFMGRPGNCAVESRIVGVGVGRAGRFRDGT
jgi:hypothetical protein